MAHHHFRLICSAFSETGGAPATSPKPIVSFRRRQVWKVRRLTTTTESTQELAIFAKAKMFIHLHKSRSQVSPLPRHPNMPKTAFKYNVYPRFDNIVINSIYLAELYLHNR
jgi:hypothetical protein